MCGKTGDQDEVTKDSGGRAADHCPGSATLARYSGRWSCASASRAVAVSDASCRRFASSCSVKSPSRGVGDLDESVVLPVRPDQGNGEPPPHRGMAALIASEIPPLR